MKALSLLQPWASACVVKRSQVGFNMAVKSIETRNWGTKYRGDLLIHASKGKSHFNKLAMNTKLIDYIESPEVDLGFHERDMPLGVIIGKVTLIDVVQFGVGEIIDHRGSNNSMTYFKGNMMWKISDEEILLGDYSVGRYGWLLAHPILFDKPIPMKGKLGIWEVDDRLIQPF
jgi:activating signal cointegrator 1